MKKIISILLVLFAAFSAYSQSAYIVTEILDAEEATFGHVCYLAAVQQGLIDEYSTYNEAVQVLYEENQIPELYNELDSISLIEAASIFSHMWDIKGGLMYRITKGAPRYVFRQFQSDGVIAASVEPKTHISGAGVLSLYTSCLRKYGNYDISTAEVGEE